jgi:hypothetical protein
MSAIMPLPESALLLGGFALAHACWSISDEPTLLCPLAIVEKNCQRELLRFEADTQVAAIANGKEVLVSLKDADAWAFAREGLFNEGDKKTDVISREVWAKGSSETVILIQRFEPFVSRKHFRLIGEPEVSVKGILQDKAWAEAVLTTINKGVMQHSKVAPLWAGWKTS